MAIVSPEERETIHTRLMNEAYNKTREELSLALQTVKDMAFEREELCKRIETLNKECEKNRSSQNFDQIESQSLRKENEQLRAENETMRGEIMRMTGMFDMLERLGTIPPRKSGFDINGAIPTDELEKYIWKAAGDPRSRHR